MFPRDAEVHAPMRQINDALNEIIKHYADNKHVFYLNINSVFLTKDGELTREIMPDLLHPGSKGYELWAQAMEPKLKALLNGN